MSPLETKILMVMIFCIVFVIALIVFFVYHMARQHQAFASVKQGFEESKIRLIEKERRLFAADLHDDMAPLLSITKLKMGAVRPESERDKRFKLEACSHIEEIYSKIRQLARNFSPVETNDLGPLYMIDQFVKEYMDSLPMKIEVHPVVCRDLTPDRSIQVYRILQEIIHNAVKHSRARQLHIRGEFNGRVLSIFTYDDGVGFKEQEIAAPKGQGLQNIRTRAEMINAFLGLSSDPGTGTQYLLRVKTDQRIVLS